MENKAAELLGRHMERAYIENPRKEHYRTLHLDTLLNMLKQNIAEIELAFKHDNDVEDKLADAGNYIAFIYRNITDPPIYPRQSNVQDLVERLKGRVLTGDEAIKLVEEITMRVRNAGEHRVFRRRLRDMAGLGVEEGTGILTRTSLADGGRQMRIVEGKGYPEPSGFGKIGPEDDNTP